MTLSQHAIHTPHTRVSALFLAVRRELKVAVGVVDEGTDAAAALDGNSPPLVLLRDPRLAVRVGHHRLTVRPVRVGRVGVGGHLQGPYRLILAVPPVHIVTVVLVPLRVVVPAIDPPAPADPAAPVRHLDLEFDLYDVGGGSLVAVLFRVHVPAERGEAEVGGWVGRDARTWSEWSVWDPRTRPRCRWRRKHWVWVWLREQVCEWVRCVKKGGGRGELV